MVKQNHSSVKQAYCNKTVTLPSTTLHVNAFLLDVQINDGWLSELVAQGYSQLVEECGEAESFISETNIFEDYSAIDDCLHGKRAHTDIPTPLKPISLSTDQDSKDIYMKGYLDTLRNNMRDPFDEIGYDFQCNLNFSNKPYGPPPPYHKVIQDKDRKNYVHPLDQDIEHPFQTTSLQPDDPSLGLADNDILNIAPSEGERPVNQIHSESLCFPKEFPMGNNTFLSRTESGEFKQNREVEISLTKYFDARILSMDNRFVSNPEYVFYAQYLKERQQIRDAAKVAMKKGPSRTADGCQLTAEMLVDNDKFRKNVIKNSLGYKYLSETRATPPYWEKVMNGLFAAFKQIGPATFFLSFSAADRRWPEIAKAILIQQNKDPSLADTLDWSEYCKLINSNPLTAVLMFERRVSQFLKLLTSKAEPLGGEVTDIFLRRENQVGRFMYTSYGIRMSYCFSFFSSILYNIHPLINTIIYAVLSNLVSQSICAISLKVASL